MRNTLTCCSIYHQRYAYYKRTSVLHVLEDTVVHDAREDSLQPEIGRSTVEYTALDMISVRWEYQEGFVCTAAHCCRSDTE